jgi:hypothetical protein
MLAPPPHGLGRDRASGGRRSRGSVRWRHDGRGRPRHEQRRGTGSAALWLALALTIAGCSREPGFRRQAQKEAVIEAIRQTLLSSVEAEKSAVLATTDEESLQMARESQDLATKVERMRDELRTSIVLDGRPVELECLHIFEARWRELVEVDERLLALAVANTNLKAARLSAREGLAAIDRFVDALDQVQRDSAAPETIRTVGAASVAAMREQALLLIHIPTADDEEMTRLEQQMSMLSESVDRTLASLRADRALPKAALEAASSAWAEHRRITVEVLRLSRENSNVRSFDVSVHEKRKVTRECLDALAALRAAVESGPQPGR